MDAWLGMVPLFDHKIIFLTKIFKNGLEIWPNITSTHMVLLIHLVNFFENFPTRNYLQKYLKYLICLKKRINIIFKARNLYCVGAFSCFKYIFIIFFWLKWILYSQKAGVKCGLVNISEVQNLFIVFINQICKLTFFHFETFSFM